MSQGTASPLGPPPAIAIGLPSSYDRELFSLEHLGSPLYAVHGALAAPPAPKRLRVALELLEAALLTREEQNDTEFRQSLIGAVPNLRAFAISLSHNADRADDLVQETLVRGWDKRARFQLGTNLHAWLFTILRNAYFSEHRKRSREVQDADGSYAARLTTAPDQIDRLHLGDVQTALKRLSTEQREALLLVSLEGLSYEQAAAVCQCAVGTVKSRVNRGRIRLAELLRYTGGDLDTDGIMRAVLTKT